MRQAPIDELVKQCGSIYKLVVISAKRAKELSEGAPKVVGTDIKKVTSLALEEIRQGKVLCKPAEGEAPKRERRTKERAKGKESSVTKARQSVSAGSKKKKS